MFKIFTTLCLVLGFQLLSWAQIKISSTAGTFDTLKAGTIVYYQYAWDQPLDEGYPVTLKLPKSIKAFETLWDSMKISEGSLILVSSTNTGAKLIVDGTGWDIKDKGWINDTLGLTNISPITVSLSGNEVEWLDFGFSNELDTLNAMPSNGSMKIALDTMNKIHFIYGDFAIVRPDLCFEGFGSLHPSITYMDSNKVYKAWYLSGNPLTPLIDTFSKVAFDNLPPLGQKITIDFGKTNFVKRISPLNVNVFPNPTYNQLNITGINPMQSNYQIIAMDGRMIEKGKLNSNVLQIEHLKTGHYILKINVKGEVYYARFVKTDL